MRALDQAEAQCLARQHKDLRDRSYFALAAIHGYSCSELEAAMADGLLQQFAAEEDGQRLLLSLHDVDPAQGHARIQLHGERVTRGLRAFLALLMAQLGVQRLYSYVFTHEAGEISVLSALGFEREAVLRQHVYLRGSYLDLCIYGLLGEAT